MLIFRATCFYIGYATATILWGALGALVGWLVPYPARFYFIVGCWTRFCLWWLRVTCGIRHQVSGLENLPDQPCIVLCRHESTWETLFMQSLFSPQATLIKRELLWIPFFGWAFRTLRPIAIDRNEPRKALRQVVRDGSARLESGIWVLLFPEGTRLPHGVRARLHPGGAALASASGQPILVVVHDAGAYWPAHAYRKHPGTIRVSISPPIEVGGRSTKELHQEITATFDRLLSEQQLNAGTAPDGQPDRAKRPG